jgi:ABC-type molybdenum transport system ATPase subunit/photorepair protein PhrA
MNLTRISVTQLFGVFDHCVELDEHDSPITIIYGPNGFGKTTLLELVANTLSGDLEAVARVPFGELALDLDDGRQLVVTESASLGARTRVLALALDGEQPCEYRAVGARPTELGHASDAPVGESPTSAAPRAACGADGPEWLDTLGRSLPVCFVDAARLFTPNSDNSAAERYADAISERLEGALMASASVAQSLDRSFPRRVLERDPDDAPAYDELRATLDDLERRRVRLARLGLYTGEAEEFELPDQLEEDRRNVASSVVSVYLEDAERTLGPLEEAAARLGLLMDMLEAKLVFKRPVLHAGSGLRFIEPSGREVPVAELSSGEQHLFVLGYRLLFDTPRGALVLIDEPELSMHVLWQEQLLEDLLVIATERHLSCLIATHSPEIISDKWHWAVELRGPADETER